MVLLKVIIPIELPDDIREDITTILDNYSDLNFNQLLNTGYEKYPAYAKKSKRKKQISQKKRDT